MARVLVTGASGFVGYHLVQALRARGDEVTCLVRKTSHVEQLEPLGVRLAYGDVTEPDGLGRAVAGMEVVYHAAGCTTALDRQEYFAVNTEGTRRIAQACAEQPAPPVLLIVSSLAAAGPSPGGRPRREEDPPRPVSEYGKSKLAAEHAARCFAHRVPVTVVRPPFVMGQRDAKGVEVYRAVRRLGVHANAGLAVHRFSLIHAEDLAQALILAAERGKRLRPARDPGEECDSTGIYFAASEERPSYVELGRMIAAEVGRPRAWILRVPRPVVWLVGSSNELLGRIRGKPLALNLDKVREALAGSWVCSTDRAQRELGFRVTTPLAERIRQTARWYLDQGWI